MTKSKPGKQQEGEDEPRAAAGDLADGESTTMAGSGAQPYVLRNIGGVYSCSCPAWRNQSSPPERRTCKHLRRLRGEAAETARVGAPAAGPARKASSGASAAAPAAGDEPPGTAPPILLAHAWDQVFDLSGWWMSEKLDGVRAYWDGERFISRLGNPFFAPAWFVAGLPAVPLDGELWAGRKRFQRAVSIARRQDGSDEWRELTYVVFDAPSAPGPFEERLAYVREHLERARPPHARWHEHERCRGLDHVRAELARVEALGGEGLMMREPGSRYEIGRSWTLRKVKTFHDAEARVIAHVRGTGKHAGRLGSLQCELPDGTVFNVGTGLSDRERAAPPPIGSIVTYRYQELSADGVPRFPSYVGVRHDVAWPPAGPPALTAPSPWPAPSPAARATPAAPAPRATLPAAQAPSAAPAPGATPPAAPAPKAMSPAATGRRATSPAATGRRATSPAATAAGDKAATGADQLRRVFVRGEVRWTIELDGRAVRIRTDEPDAPVELATRQSASPAAAWRDAERLIADRVGQGFVELL